MTRPQNAIFDAVVRIDKLPASGRSVTIDADESTRQAIAVAMNIVSVERFTAALTVVPFRGGLRATGELSAAITQASVVSFEPVQQDVAEDIDRVFLPAPKQGPGPGSETYIDLEDDDFPDHIDGPEVDLSGLLLETLALALDPYPRGEGESLETLGLGKDDTEEHPFAKLATLKSSGGDKS